MSRILSTAAILVLLVTSCASDPTSRDGGIDVLDVSGPLDASALAFLSDSIDTAAGQQRELVVLQLNSRAVLDGEEFDRLAALVRQPPVPVAVWVGPAPATVLGGASLLPFAAAHGAMAPGATWGVTNPVVLGEDRVDVDGPQDRELAETSGLDLQPTISQLLASLDGVEFATSGGPVVVDTIDDAGVPAQITFYKPGFMVRFFRLAVTPEAAFFFLVVGLAIVTFEFYALGPGVAAGVAGLSLILAGWGIVTIPVRGWALGVALISWALLTWAYQRGGVLVVTVLAAVLMQISGMYFIDGAGQIDPRWWLVLPSVLGVLFFFLLAMPTVQRARLSTQTIGRESLVGHTGTALVDFDPEGTVEVEGARWRATGHREAGIHAGAAVVVTGVDGLYLEVERLVTDRET